MGSFSATYVRRAAGRSARVRGRGHDRPSASRTAMPGRPVVVTDASRRPQTPRAQRWTKPAVEPSSHSDRRITSSREDRPRRRRRRHSRLSGMARGMAPAELPDRGGRGSSPDRGICPPEAVPRSCASARLSPGAHARSERERPTAAEHLPGASSRRGSVAALRAGGRPALTLRRPGPRGGPGRAGRRHPAPGLVARRPRPRAAPPCHPGVARRARDDRGNTPTSPATRRPQGRPRGYRSSKRR